MESNSPNVTPADASAITDRYEVKTNIVAEPVKAEPTTKVESKPESDFESEPSEDPQESKTINPRTQARKAEKERLIRENAAATERNKQLEAELAKYKQPSGPDGKKSKDLSKEPNIQDYDDALEWSRDIAKYEAIQAFSEGTSKQTQQKQKEAYSERAAILRADKPDFDEKVGSLIESGLLTEEVENSILASNVSAELSYHLAQYNGDLLALRGLPKELLPKAIKEIESFIAKGGTPQEKPRVTQASPPITPPGNSAKTNRSISSYTQQEIENMPLAEFRRLSKH